MELIKRNTGYGLRALLHMAAHRETEAFTAEALAEAADTSTDFMHKIMRALKDAGIVSARRGPAGGSSFARKPEEITVLDVVLALQGPLQVNRCVIGFDVCPRSGTCPLRPTWLRVQQELEAGLDSQTIGEIAANLGEDEDATNTSSGD